MNVTMLFYSSMIQAGYDRKSTGNWVSQNCADVFGYTHLHM